MEKSSGLAWLGIITVLSGLLEIVSFLLYTFAPVNFSSPTYFTASLLDQAGGLLFLFTLFAIYSTHAPSGGWFNKLSFFIGVFGTALFDGQKWMETFVIPFVFKQAPNLLKVDPSFPLSIGFNLSFLLFTIGLILVGISIIVQKRLPLVTAIGLIIAPLLDWIPTGNIHPSVLIFALATLYLGAKLPKTE